MTGEKTGIFMDADSSLNAAKAIVTTNTMESAGATTLTNGALNALRALKQTKRSATRWA